MLNEREFFDALSKRGNRFTGAFVFGAGSRNERRLINTIVADGANYILRDIWRKETTLLPDTSYLGLTNAAYTPPVVSLATLAAGEPSGNGYARQALNRDTTDWTVDTVNGIARARSKNVSFTASANWDKTYLGAFIATTSDNTGKVMCVSGYAAAGIQAISGAGPTVAYELYLPQ